MVLLWNTDPQCAAEKKSESQCLKHCIFIEQWFAKDTGGQRYLEGSIENEVTYTSEGYQGLLTNSVQMAMAPMCQLMQSLEGTL